MYVIVEKEKLEGKFFGMMNFLPDGRAYIPIGEIRNVGTLMGVDIIGSSRELKELIEKQGEEIKNVEEIDPDFGREPIPDAESGESPEITGAEETEALKGGKE